jgi:hypothetical protein
MVSEGREGGREDREGGREGGKKGRQGGREGGLKPLAKTVSFSKKTGDCSPRTHRNQGLLLSDKTQEDMKDISIFVTRQ